MAWASGQAGGAVVCSASVGVDGLTVVCILLNGSSSLGFPLIGGRGGVGDGDLQVLAILLTYVLIILFHCSL